MRFPVMLLLPLAVACTATLGCRSLETAGPVDASRWNEDVARMVAAHKDVEMGPKDVLFVGSSSIRMWRTLSEDFPDRTVLNHGFGGSQMSDVNAHLEDLVLRYEPSIIVVYEGDNDVASGKSPGQFLTDVRWFVKRVKLRLPDADIGFLAVKPSPSRENLMDVAAEANEAVVRLCAGDDSLHFIDIWTPMLGDDGKPKGELFLDDRLHMNESGYVIWKREVDRFLASLAKRPNSGN